MTPEQKLSIDRHRAFGLLFGALSGVAFRLSADEKVRIDKLLKEAEGLWDEHELTTKPAKATT